MHAGPISVVIVDDLRMVRETLKLILDRDTRFEVTGQCASGEEAILAAGTLSPQVMLMDIGMSPVNGFEATRKISRLYPFVKIIGVSINDQAGYVRNMLQLGAKGYVTKKAHHNELIEAIIAVHSGETYVCKEMREKMSGDFP